MESEAKTEAKISEVRVRIAPSPTGGLHLGTARSSLFNYLFAKKNNGNFILRIEDTDRERSKPEYEENIINGLKWLGIEWDEGPDIGGPCGHYRQSEKTAVYRQYLEKLLDEDKAYYCFCSEEELDAQKQYQLSIGRPPKYNGACSQLNKEEAARRIKEGGQPVIRFRVIEKKVKFDDLIRGTVEFDSSLFGDFVIAKSINSPLYNFAVVVDDFDMKITHIIRGEEHLSNTPRQILIQEALAFPKTVYAHLPLILAPDRSKMSKRHGSVSIDDYRNQGYLAEALVNFIAFLGWSPGDEREIYNLSSLAKEFSLENCHKAGAIFNIKKLDSLNGFYIRQKSAEKLTELCLPFLVSAGLIEEIDGEKEEAESDKLILVSVAKPKFAIKETGEILNWQKLEKMISAYRERLKKLSEIVELADFFFKKELFYPKELLRWQNDSEEETKKALNKLIAISSEIKDDGWSKENLEAVFIKEAAEFSQVGDRGHLLWPLRVALSGKKASATPFEIAEILEKQKTIERLDQAVKLIT